MKQNITFKILQVLYIVVKVVLNPVPYQLVIILHHTVHWTSKKGGTGGQGEVGGATNRVTCTWFESATVGTGWATYLPDSMVSLRKNTSLTCRELVSGQEGCLGCGWVYDNR